MQGQVVYIRSVNMMLHLKFLLIMIIYYSLSKEASATRHCTSKLSVTNAAKETVMGVAELL